MPEPPLRFLSPIHKATRHVGLYLEGFMAEQDLTNVESHVLAYLASYAPRSVGELSRVFGHPASTLTSILDRLDEKGLVTRDVNPEDRRSFLIGLTASGRARARRVRRVVEELESRIARRVGKRELEGFQAVMEAIGQATDNVTKEKGSP